MKFILFADDTNIFYSNSNLERAQNVINMELEKFTIWFKVNKLPLNVKNTNYIIFTTKSVRNEPVLKLNDIMIDRVF